MVFIFLVRGKVMRDASPDRLSWPTVILPAEGRFTRARPSLFLSIAVIIFSFIVSGRLLCSGHALPPSTIGRSQ